jgi:hypothetical protein
MISKGAGELIKVGFWKSDGFAQNRSATGNRVMDMVAEVLFMVVEAPLPSVFDHIDRKWDPKERDLVAKHIADHRFRGESYLGDSVCRMCGRANGSADFKDGEYLWPEGLVHYVRDHHVRLPSAFVQHVLKKTRR